MLITCLATILFGNSVLGAVFGFFGAFGMSCLAIFGYWKEKKTRMVDKQIKVFKYIEELDAFLPEQEFVDIVRKLGLSEWTDVVFICRYLALDNDYGEHIFDNWDQREEREEKAKAMGIDEDELLIVDPERFQNGWDGPCHSPNLRKMFWTDVLKSMHLSLIFLFEEARREHKRERKTDPRVTYNLEEVITDLTEKYGS